MPSTSSVVQTSGDRRAVHDATAHAWLASRGPDVGITTSNVDGADFAMQRWYRFKEAFSPRFVREAFDSLGFDPRTCTDPFGGSGTTALACQFFGVRPTTIEVNPFLADLIEAKLTAYDTRALVAARAALAAAVTRSGPADSDPFPGAPSTFVPPGRGGRWIFDTDVATRIAVYREAIAEIQDLAARRLFRVLLGAVLVPVSNVVISGKGRRYRAATARSVFGPSDVDRLFDAGYRRALYDITRYGTRAHTGYALLRGDARTRVADAEPADLVLFSPPYPNSFDYTDIYNVELWALGYLRESADNRALREATLRSHVQIKREFGAGDLGSETLARTVEALTTAREALWNPHIPAMVRAYAEDLKTVLVAARGVLTPRGRIMMVVGDSRYAGVHVDVPAIVSEFAPAIGLRCEERRAVRSMRASAQQGGDYALGESLLRFAPL